MIFEDNLLIKLAMDWSESADFINRSFASSSAQRLDHGLTVRPLDVSKQRMQPKTGSYIQGFYKLKKNKMFESSILVVAS